MKNANIFVDVDLTLVDAEGRLLAGAREALVQLRDRGCHLFLWSSNGADYARRVAGLHQLAPLFEGFAAKPDIVIDDMPATTRAPFIFEIREESSWPILAQRILATCVD